MSVLEDFFRDIDASWNQPAADKIPLKIIGSSALMLQAGYERGTKDGDVLETGDLSPEIKSRLLDIAGPKTRIHQRRKLYLDVVPNGVPFLPQQPEWIPLAELSASLAHFDLAVLGVVDVVVSKLKRFNSDDAADIDAMVERDLVPHSDLVARFQRAVDYWSSDARADDLPKYVENLHRVERDMLVVEETEIELPGWI